MTAYSTFWRRFWAGFIDSFVVGIPLAIVLGIALAMLGLHRYDPGVRLASDALFNVVFIAYSILMHSRSGQTVGKRATSVIVLDVTETRVPTLKEAALRDIGDIIPTALVIGFSLAGYLSGDFALNPDRYVAVSAPLSLFTGLWFLTELVTMMTNSKRRALHDYIAGTVVMRKDSVSVGGVDRIA